MRQPLYLYLYAEPRAPTLDINQLQRYLKELAPSLEVNCREDFFAFYLAGLTAKEKPKALKRIVEHLAKARVRHALKPLEDFTPLPGEIDYEIRRLSDPSLKSFGILYDGLKLMGTLREMLPPQERSLSHLHILFTNQLIGTWEEADHRYHARASLYGFPSLISTTGIVEAPAKPREYYLLKQQYTTLGMTDAPALLETRFQGRTLQHNDPRLTEVMKGYVLQALFHHLWGDPFCSDKNCRLFNAHWQEEVIQAQLAEGKLCPLHQRQLQQLRFCQ